MSFLEVSGNHLQNRSDLENKNFPLAHLNLRSNIITCNLKIVTLFNHLMINLTMH